jgi:hypothetical protein
MCAQFHEWEMIGDGAPTFVRDFAEIVQYHYFIFDFPKQTNALIRDDGHEIRACLCVIISLQADGFPMMFVWMEFGMWVSCHGCPPFLIPLNEFYSQ